MLSQIADFKYPVSVEMGLIWWKERLPLLLKCFKTLFGSMGQIHTGSGGIYHLLMGQTSPVFTNLTAKF